MKWRSCITSLQLTVTQRVSHLQLAVRRSRPATGTLKQGRGHYLNRNKYLAGVVSLLVFNVIIYGQGPWGKKPYQEWSESDASKMLFESPWAQSKSDRSSPYFVNIRLHSAPAIRQALVRYRQIRINYKKLGKVRF